MCVYEKEEIRGGGGILVNSNYYIPSTKLLFVARGYEAIIYGILYELYDGNNGVL
jgi:hypothetical protein